MDGQESVEFYQIDDFLMKYIKQTYCRTLPCSTSAPTTYTCNDCITRYNAYQKAIKDQTSKNQDGKESEQKETTIGTKKTDTPTNLKIGVPVEVLFDRDEWEKEEGKEEEEEEEGKGEWKGFDLKERWEGMFLPFSVGEKEGEGGWWDYFGGWEW